jgi:ribose transport system substrate-binding protein
MKRFFALTLVLVLVLALCVSTTAEQDIFIAVNLKTLSAEYWQVVKAGCEAAASDLGVGIEVQGATAETEIAEQVAQIETQLGAAPSAIVIAPNDGDAVSGALESSGFTGPVIFCDTDCAYAAKTSFVGTSNEEAAYQGGVYGVSINGDATKAVIIYGQEGDNTSNLRKAGYERALAEAGLTPLAELSGNNTTDGATKVMEDLLNAYPNEINLVLCMNDDTAVGALNAIEAAGATGITIIGFNGDSFILDLIEAGTIEATIAQQPELMGYQAVETAVKAIRGEAVALDNPVATALINKDNVAQYK